MRLFLLSFFFVCGVFFVTNAHAAKPETGSEHTQENDAAFAYMQLKDGVVKIRLRPDLAPHHVIRIKELIAKGFYDGLTFHRVIDGFMAQTGDPKGDGTGGSGQNLAAEFSSAPHLRGTVSMARAMNPDSADSQFFIVLAPAPHLDGQYTVWGEVVEGMNFVDTIKKGDPMNNGAVTQPDRIIKMSLVDPAPQKKNVP
jgi:peptidylprolyl isomerase